MKKIMLIACACLIALMLVACGGKTSAKTDATPSSNSSAAVSASSTSSSDEGSFSTANKENSSALSDASSNSGSDDGVVVPDLVGKNLKDVKSELKPFDVDYYKTDGSKANVFNSSNWRIDAQSIEPGATVPKDTKLELTLGHITEEKAAERKANEEAKKRVMFYATQAREQFPYYQHEKIGYNYRMSNICAGIGRGQMTVADEHIRHHQWVHEQYVQRLEGIDELVVHSAPTNEMEPNYWLSTIRFNDGKTTIVDDKHTFGHRDLSRRVVI